MMQSPRQSKVIPMPRPKWSQRDYQKASRLYLRGQLMTKVVEAVIASKLSYKQVAEKSGVARSTIHNWVSGHTANGKLDTVTSVLNGLGLDLTITDKRR